MIDSNVPYFSGGHGMSADELNTVRRKIKARATSSGNSVGKNAQKEEQADLLDTLKAGSYISAREVICLYIPEALSTAHILDWETESFAASSLATQSFKDAIKGASESWAEEIKTVLGGIADAAKQFAISSLFAPDTIRSFAGAAGRVVKNPYMEMLFKGVQNRKFEMSFKFTPKTPKEARAVHDIVQTFKLWAHPALPAGREASTALKQFFISVSYTHLTLPTNREV